MADPCQPLRTQIQGQEQTIQLLQQELQQASPAEKPFIIDQINEAKDDLAQLNAQLAACVNANPQPDAVVLTTDTCPICTDEQITIWRHVVLNQLGVDGTDVDGHWIGGYPNDSKQVIPEINNWFPLSVVKRVFCGELHHFQFYDPWTSGDEADWNNFMIPTPAFLSLFEDAKIYEPTGQWTSCAGENTFDCIEAEITPDESYYENVFNSKELGESALQGEVVCTYGPWVREWSHDNKPEIHPSELYWWRSQLPNGNFAYTLMQVQEDSNRFDREGNYDFGLPWDDPPSNWRAWSQNPRTNAFRIAFEFNPAAAARTFRIRHLESKRVQERWQDATPGSTHDLQYNERVVLRVEELLPNEGHLGVGIGSICRNAANTRLQGYIWLIATVGENDRGGEGYQTLQVEVDEPPFIGDALIGDWPVLATLERPARRPIVQVEARPGSLRRVEIDGQPQLVGDAEIRVTPRPGTAAAKLDLSKLKVELVTPSKRRELRFQPPAAARGGRVPDGIVEEVSLTDEARLEVTVAGEMAPVPVPSLALTPRIITEAPQQLTEAPRAWSAMAAAVIGRPTKVAPPVSVVRARRWRIEATPVYAPLRAGKVSPGDDSPFADALNAIIRGSDPRRLKELFGSARPIRVTWSFLATNLTSGRKVPVHKGSDPGPTAVGVVIGQGEKLNSEITVTFPEQPANAIFELVATARMRDTFGLVGTVRHRVSSHLLTHSDTRDLADSLVRTAAALAETSPDELDSASDLGAPVFVQLDDDPRVMDLRSSRATMVRLLAMDASQNQRINVDELRRLVRGAKLFAGTK